MNVRQRIAVKLTLIAVIIALVANGMLTYDFLIGAHIVDELGTVLGSAQREPTEAQSHWVLRQLAERFVSQQRDIPIVNGQ